LVNYYIIGTNSLKILKWYFNSLTPNKICRAHSASFKRVKNKDLRTINDKNIWTIFNCIQVWFYVNLTKKMFIKVRFILTLTKYKWKRINYANIIIGIMLLYDSWGWRVPNNDYKLCSSTQNEKKL